MIRSENKAKAYFAGITAIYIVISFVVAFLPEKFLTSEMSILLGQSVVIIPGVIYCIINRRKVLKEIPFKKISFLNILLVILFTYAVLPVVTLINAISMLFVENSVSTVLDDFTRNPFLLALFMVAVLPAVFEEFSFRGIIYNGLKSRNILYAIIVSGVSFGLFHMNINQFLYATVLGVVLALLAEATDTILAPMLMHFIFNSNSVVLTYLMEWLQKFINQSTAETEKITEEAADYLGAVIAVYAVIGLIAGVIAFLLFMLIAKRCKRWEHIKSIFVNKKVENREKRKLLPQDIVCTVLYWMAVIVAILVMILNEVAK